MAEEKARGLHSVAIRDDKGKLRLHAGRTLFAV